MGKGFTEAERQIVSALIESKAVDFDALGKVFAQNAASATLHLDGEDWFCGTMRRFIRVYRLPGPGPLDLEQLAELGQLRADVQAR